MQFYKFHALGNDYIVLDPADIGTNLTESQIRLICHRHYGIGSDGILFGPFPSSDCDFALRIFNPDASEAEKSGNGLRIFSRYLWDKGLVKEKPFTIFTAGGTVISRVHEEGSDVTVEMGTVTFESSQIPVLGESREVLNENIIIDGHELTFCAASIGNPHCIILREDISAEETQKWGPLLEVDPRFPHRTNVQFLKILNRKNLQLEIWERGAGYTLASGSSSSAAAAVAFRLGLCDRQVSVHMPGGTIAISISDNFFISMTGPVTKIAEGILSPEIFSQDR